MKKLLLILLFTTAWMQGQTLQNPTYNNTTTNTLKIKTPATVTSVSFLSTIETDGSVAKIAPVNLPFVYGTGTVNYIPYFSGIKTLSDSNIYLNGSFPPPFSPTLPNFVAKTIIKGNANGNTSGEKLALAITDDTDKIVAEFDNTGRLDLKDYGGQGGVMCLYNLGTPAVNRRSHYAFAARNSIGDAKTINTIWSYVTDPTSTTMSSKLGFQFMDNLDTSPAGFQPPNKEMFLDKNGLDLPLIPIKNATELQLKNNNSGSAPASIKYYANNTQERGTLTFSVNATSPFEADLVYRTNGFSGTPGTDRFKIDGHTGAVTIYNLAGVTSALLETDVNGNIQRSTSTARPYKVYTAYILQSGTSAPTATVLENNLGGTVIFTRTSTGIYRATLNGVINSSKTVAFFNYSSYQAPGNQYTSALTPTSDYLILASLNNGNLADSILGGSLEIRVYP